MYVVLFLVLNSLCASLVLQDGRTPLMRMSLEGSIECVEILLDRGAQTNQQDKVCLPFCTSL